MRLTVAFLALVLSGCSVLQRMNHVLPGYDPVAAQEVSVPDRRSPQQKVLDSWLGKPEAQLIKEWGLPHRHMVNESNMKIYEYDQCAKPVGMTFYPGFNPITVTNQRCARWTFMIADGVIKQDQFTPL